MGDQALRLRVSGNQRLHGRATENAGPSRRVEGSKSPAARLDPPRHEAGDGNRREEEAMLLAAPVAGGVRRPDRPVGRSLSPGMAKEADPASGAAAFSFSTPSPTRALPASEPAMFANEGAAAYRPRERHVALRSVQRDAADLVEACRKPVPPAFGA